MCPVDEILDQAVEHAEYTLTPSKMEFQQGLCASAQTRLASAWQHAMDNVYANVVPNINASTGKVHRYERKAVIYHPTIGPFSCTAKIEYYNTQTPLQHVFLDMQSKLNHLNASFIECLKPMEFVQRVGQTLIITLSDSSGMHREWGIGARDIIHVLDTEINKNSVSTDISTSSPAMVTDIILLMKDVSALMEPTSSWPPVEEGSVDIANEIAATDEHGIKLTGAHEIKYGAYSASAATAISAASSVPSQQRRSCQDPLFIKTCEYLFQFLGNNLYERRVTLISSGWHNGYNFFITRGSSSTIAHHTLLVPSPYHSFDNNMDHMYTMRRLKLSMPPNCEVNLAYTPEESTEERIFVKMNDTRNLNKRNNAEPSYKFIPCGSIAKNKVNPLIVCVHTYKPLYSCACINVLILQGHLSCGGEG